MALSGWISFWIFVCLLPCTFTLAPVSRSLISINFCCEDDAFLKTELVPSQFGFARTTAKCSDEEQFPSKANSSSLEWERTQVKDLANGELMEMSIRKSEVKDINCYNINPQDLDIHISGSDHQGDFQNRSGQGFDIRLVGGYSDREGNVLVNGQPICDDSWDLDDANVACRMLGFEGAEDAVCCSEFGSHGSTYIMDDLRCNGHEDSLFECDYDRSDNCGSSETAGVRCRGELGPSGNFLTADGGIINAQGMEWEPNSFCLVPKSATRISAVKCLPSMAILPTLLDTAWTSLGDAWLFHAFGHIVDTNRDGRVEKEEFDDFVHGKIRELFNLLDTNSNGGIDVNEGRLLENIPFKLFEKVIEFAVQYFDVDKDNKVTLVDVNRLFRGPRSEVDKHLSDLFGQPLISLPGPFYKLYTLLDRDLQEDLSLDEAMDFLQATFMVLDGNQDCKLSLDELVAGVKNANLPSSFGAAIHIMAHQYVTLGDFILTEFFKIAGQNSDGIATIDSVLGFDDWDWFENKMVPLAINVGYPTVGPLYILTGDGHRSRQLKNFTHLLTALNTVFDMPGFDNIGSLDNCKE